MADDYLDIHPKDGKPMTSTEPSPDMPRRAVVEKMVPAELAIREALSKVEEMPAHVRLTDAVMLLTQAQEAVADFVDWVSLEDLLRMKYQSSDHAGRGIKVSPQFVVKVQGEEEGGIHFIIHADGHNSETLDFIVKGDSIRRK